MQITLSQASEQLIKLSLMEYFFFENKIDRSGIKNTYTNIFKLKKIKIF